MLGILKNIWLGLLLIAAASALLLFSDLDRREGGGRRSPRRELPQLAILQWTSTDLLDSTVAGIVEGLRQQGYEDGRTATIRFFNAASDIAAANLMAKEATSGAFDMVLTASTLTLQTVAAANRERMVTHIFGGVTDPYGAGVGITGPAPDQHPPYMAGVGTFQPVDAAIRIAHQMNPDLKRLGVVWNPSEDNSEACVRKARETCRSLGMELVEANAGNSSEVAESARSLLGRQVQAIWVGGDTVAMAAIHAILAVARDAGIPVFSNDPTDATRGALFGLGASYPQVGVMVGDLGGKILRGADPQSFGVENRVPEVLALNEPLVGTLTGWSFMEEHLKRAEASKPKAIGPARGPESGRTYSVGLIRFGPNLIFEMAAEGVREGLREADFIEGENLKIHEVQAQNDISILHQAIQNLLHLRPDLLIPLSTPCLAGVLGSGTDIPVVFGIVTAPLEAGAGESFERHLRNVTGAVWSAPAPATFDWMARLFPQARKLGIVYNPAHASSRMEAESIRVECVRRGWELMERTLSSPSEIKETMQSLLQAQPDFVFAMGDNTVVSAYHAVCDMCRQARVPLIADDHSLMGAGALFSIGASPRSEGRHAGQISARVLLGENPADIPFAPSAEMETTVDFAAAKNLGVEFPLDLLKETDIFLHLRSLYDRPLRIAMVDLVQSRPLELSEAGVVRGLREAGLAEGEDFILKKYNAQGEIAQLPAILDAALNQNPDLIVTVTTPAMIAAANRIKDVPVVFTVGSDPIALNIFTPESMPTNLTGVHDDPAMGALLDMAMAHDPNLKSIGIVYDPAQPNSVLSVERLRTACKARNMPLLEASAATQTDLAQAVQSLVQRGMGALLTSADNLVVAGFAIVHKTASQAGVPIFTTDSNLMEEGATGSIGDDYESWGAQSGRLAAKVLAGVPPVLLPLQATRDQQVSGPGTGSRGARERIP